VRGKKSWVIGRSQTRKALNETDSSMAVVDTVLGKRDEKYKEIRQSLSQKLCTLQPGQRFLAVSRGLYTFIFLLQLVSIECSLRRLNGTYVHCRYQQGYFTTESSP
jgi:hypothetical protein